jgi:hypothetical protein
MLITICTLACNGYQNTSKSAAEAKALLDDVSAKGARAVVKELNLGSGSQWQHVIKEVQGGSSQWLEVARRLLAGADAGRTTDLFFALSIALTRNAAGVLSMIGPDLPLDKICSVPYIEPDESTIRAHRAKVRSALDRVNSPALDPLKKSCLIAVEQ